MGYMETQAANAVKFSDSAIKEIKRLVSENKNEEQFLRVGAKGGGCSGLSYILAFDQKTEKDVVYQYAGVNYIINPAHLIYLANMQIDWQGGLNSRGFTFQNPNATSNCGCGSSFSV